MNLEGITNNASLDDIKGKFVSTHQVGNDKQLVPQRLHNKNQNKDESPHVPGFDFSRSCSPSNLRLDAKHQNGQNANKNIMGICKIQIGSPAWRGCHSPNPQEPTHTPYLPHDTLTLAQLYQSSRRSRHHASPHNNLQGNSSEVVIPTSAIRSPPLAFSSPTEYICNMDAISDKTQEDDWSFDMASSICSSCSSISISSMESEDHMPQDGASELLRKKLQN